MNTSTTTKNENIAAKLSSLPSLSKIGFQLVDLNARLKEDNMALQCELNDVRTHLLDVTRTLSYISNELRDLAIVTKDNSVVTRLVKLRELLTSDTSNEEELPF